MADKKPADQPPPPPPPPASSASVKAEPVKPKKSGFDPLRPFRYAGGFIQGTYDHTLDNMANWGRKGAWVGAGIAILAVISGAAFATGGLAFIAAGWMAGLVGGAVAGGAIGLATGGVKGMEREGRRDKYADDLMKKARAKSNASNDGVDYRDAHREYKRHTDYMFERNIQQERENAHDTRKYFEEHRKTHWQDWVHHSRSDDHQRGF